MAGCFGVRLLHWGPLLAFTIIGVITTFTISCHLQWWPVSTAGGAIDMFFFLLWNTLTLYNLISAAFSGPGYVPNGWKPENSEDTQYLQYCHLCEGYKAPRSHHCRKCQRCVCKMDHHCPWINNCVGHFNHGSFTSFLFFAPCGCIHALFILIPSMYRAINRGDYLRSGRTDVPFVGISNEVFIGSMFSVSLSIGVTVALLVLLYIQMKSILRNQTGIEAWICDKAEYRVRDEDEDEEFTYPYHLGRWKNFCQVFHFRRRPELNGVYWPVVEGCDQYTLTVEQLKQKQEKKDRSVVYGIQETYAGNICPCSKGCRVFCCPPCTDEPRIKLSIGDRILVSRWKKHWLYGEKLTTEKIPGSKRIRGWFPRRCAVELVDQDEILSPENDKKNA
ncbi:hypothetical protein CAPTEDRAFT_181419 [Capitella teleta]|uniref:Palmitoyltransferase n=1 Tax=Capitella teleta TaxID=283909 RepID=R7U5R3_CAPTE|nr:hypothetical protein CAPTEDRAFT_181419 [Capitella teleta]|eukprot:ELT99036.1 hypothetical protein CAPTEDRAFT_181419 [Capitella teleta]